MQIVSLILVSLAKVQTNLNFDQVVSLSAWKLTHSVSDSPAPTLPQLSHVENPTQTTSPVPNIHIFHSAMLYFQLLFQFYPWLTNVQDVYLFSHLQSLIGTVILAISRLHSGCLNVPICFLVICFRQIQI